MELRLTMDAQGTPGITVGSEAGAFYALGYLHGRYRPLQSLLLGNAGTGRLAERLLPLPPLLHLDRTAHLLDLPTVGRREAGRLPPLTLERVQLYLAGLTRGVAAAPSSLLGGLHRLLPVPDPPALLSGFGLSAYLGLAESQGRMERALCELVQAGADPSQLEHLFRPLLHGWSPAELKVLPPLRDLAPADPGAFGTGGSNAFAVSPARSQSGRALFAADPHLVIDQLPSLFFEARIQAGPQYWLGATIPGLPAIAIGRNRDVAWSGTFAVADNVDHFCEHIDANTPLTRRLAVLGRRGLPAQQLLIAESPRGRLLWPGAQGPNLAVAWSGLEGLAETITAYLQLWTANSAAAAQAALSGSSTLSLHFILADRGGDVRYVQVGRIPERLGGWSGLPPAPKDGAFGWRGRYTGLHLPHGPAEDGIAASANEGRLGPGGAVLSTFAQPNYRLHRIRQVLSATPQVNLQTLASLQLDLHSLQADRLLPVVLANLPDGPVRRLLLAWDRRVEPHSVGAHAFQLVYRAALHGLAPVLGGRRFHQLLESTELSVWWCAALDRALADPGTWSGPAGASLASALAGVADAHPGPYGEAQTFQLRHLLAGGLPAAFGLDRGPFPLPGNISTVRQGNLVPAGSKKVAIGPAYRFVTDLGEDLAYATLPGGVDGDPWSKSYAAWLDEYREGRLHPLRPPEKDDALPLRV
ncbi:MAG: penicillin acylase family protein [Deltaproteobacteria bacterium]|nr:penicillin acylase family protein [Deltaproteobacteria bacterium]